MTGKLLGRELYNTYSLNKLIQLVMSMFTKELGNLEAGIELQRYSKGYLKKKILTDFDEVMHKVQNHPAPE